MANHFVVSGFLKKVRIAEAAPGKPASAVVMVQYGAERQRTGKRVEFVNALLVRIPSQRLEKIKARLKVGDYITLVGHHQGTLKSNGMDTVWATELVADRVEFDDWMEDEPVEGVED